MDSAVTAGFVPELDLNGKWRRVFGFQEKIRKTGETMEVSKWQKFMCF